LQPQIVAQIPDPVKVSTPAFTPAAAPVVAETAPPVKVSTPTYIVQNQYIPTKPVVTQSATNSEISIPNFSSVQRTDVPQMNSLQSGKIRIADNVVMYPELENEILETLLKFGISGTVTSAYREGAVAPSGKPSYHASRQAFDFVPRFGNSAKDFADLYARLKQSGALDYLNSKDYFILYEDENINPDSTGPHFHIGKDIKKNWVIKGENGMKIPTEDEYIAQMAAEVRERAYQTALNNLVQIVPYVEKSEDQKRQDLRHLNNYLLPKKKKLEMLYELDKKYPTRGVGPGIREYRWDEKTESELKVPNTDSQKYTSVDLNPYQDPQLHNDLISVQKEIDRRLDPYGYGPACMLTFSSLYGKNEA
jgi:hypothetical protein